MTLLRVETPGGHTYELDGRPVPGVTTVLGATVPKDGLVWWAAGSAADYAVDNWDDLAARPLSERLQLIRSAHERNRDKAAKLGTRVHHYADRLAHGDGVVPEPEARPFVDAYLRWVDEWRPEEVRSEMPLASRGAAYAGTCDLFVHLPALGGVYVADFKTGRPTKTFPYPEMATQLAAYAYAEFGVVDGEELPVPQVDGGAVLHVRPEGVTVHTVTRAQLRERMDVFLELRWLFDHQRFTYADSFDRAPVRR